MVTVDVFTLGYNEERILPYFINYYQSFCRNITFYNNCSTDKSKQICLDNKVSVIDTNINELNDLANIQIKQKCYLNSDADFVIVVDTDEFVYHPSLLKLLEMYKKDGVNLPKVRGYTMATNSGYPQTLDLVSLVKTGIPAINYAKRCVFDPRLKMQWGVGMHTLISVDGKWKESEQQDISILHYKFIDKSEIHAKKREYAARMSQFNKDNSFGSHYLTYDYNDTEKWFDGHVASSITIL